METFLNILGYMKTVFITVLLGLAVYYTFVAGNYFTGDERKIRIKKKTAIKTVLILLVLLFIYRFLSGGGFITTLIFTVSVSMVVSYFLNPLVNKLEAKKISRGFGVLIIYVGIVLLLVILFKTVGPKIGDEISRLVKNLPSYINDIYRFSVNLYDRISPEIENLPIDMGSIEDSIASGLDNLKNVLGNSIMGIINSSMKFISRALNLVLIPVFTFYFLKDKSKYKEVITENIPKKFRKDIVGLGRDIDEVLGQYVRGQLLVCLFIGVATTAALLIIGVDFAIIIGIFAGIFNIIPYLGPIIGLIPAVIFAAFEDPTKIIWVVVAITVIQQAEGNFITPRIIGKSVGLHPTVVMVGVLIGGGYFGLIGMLLAVPTVATFRVVYKFIVKKLSEMKDEEIIPLD